MIGFSGVLQRSWRHFMSDSLYRNSIFLLLSSLVNAGFGFVFWIICARLFSQHEVGVATALISLAGLASGFGILGFNNSIIRFLPKTDNKNQLLNSAFTMVLAVSSVVGIIFLAFLAGAIDSIELARSSMLNMLIFLIAVPGTAINGILDNVFTAFRATQFTLYKNSVTNLVKIGLVFPLLQLGGFGIFAAYGLSFALVALASAAVLIKKFEYKPKIEVKQAVLKSVAKFSLANYAVSYINGFPALILPVIIASMLGAQDNAVYYIAYTVASLLFFIPLGVANSLFAEGSHSDEGLMQTIRKAMKINGLLTIPAIVLTIVFAPLLLMLFGGNYQDAGTYPLRVMALSAVFVAICYPCGSILNIKHQLRALMITNAVGATAVVGLVYLFIELGHGLRGAVWGWCLGWMIYAAVYLFATTRALKH